jgi:transposase
LVGQRLTVPYEAPQGRRVNVLGLYFSHGPLAGEFQFVSYASLPKPKSKQPRQSLAERAAVHGLLAEEVGRIDSDVFLAFVWTVAGRPPDAPAGWRRERPLVIVLDNYQVHKSTQVKEERPRLAAANIELFYLPPYCPELSGIEPIWQDVKYNELPERSYAQAGGLKRAVDTALARKAIRLRQAHRQTTDSSLRPA